MGEDFKINNDTMYTVMPGDTIHFIEYKMNLPSGSIVQLNPRLKDNFLYLGQQLRIK